MFTTKTNEKIIKYTTIILKLCAFYFFERWFRLFHNSFLWLYSDLEQYISLAFNYKLPNIIEFSYHILLLYLYTIFSYFCAKRLGVINFLNKFPFWLSFIIVILFVYIADYNPLDLSTLLLTPLICIFGTCFLNVYTIYKLTKFLIKKFPKELGFLRYFYPKFLDKMPDILVLFLTIIVVKIAIPYVIKTEGTDYFMQPFIPSGNYFLYLMIFFFIVKIVLLIYNYYNEHYK